MRRPPTRDTYHWADWGCALTEAQQIHARAWRTAPPAELGPHWTPADRAAWLDHYWPSPLWLRNAIAHGPPFKGATATYRTQGAFREYTWRTIHTKESAHAKRD